MKTSTSKGISYCILGINTSASLDCGMCFMHFEAEVFMCKYTIAYKNNALICTLVSISQSILVSDKYISQSICATDHYFNMNNKYILVSIEVNLSPI